MSTVSTHVLDTSLGGPAVDVHVALYRQGPNAWEQLSTSVTDVDGRAASLLQRDEQLTPGTYRLRFATGAYSEARRTMCFYPRVDVVFTIEAPDEHYHVPLLLSPFGFSTYRGS